MAFRDITAAEWTAQIRVGWIIGNTFDAYGNATGSNWADGGTYADMSVTEMETKWGNPITLRENFDAVKNAGFNAVRIPVTWGKACDEDDNIRADWMARVKEVVDFAVANDLYIILNSHHDDHVFFHFYDKDMERTSRKFVRIWEQIAETFKDYDEKLIFEPLNEPGDVNSELMWQGGTPEIRENINVLNQLFVDTVRKSGGNNARRVLMIACQAAHIYAYDLSIIADLRIPKDTVPDKIIVTVHEYCPHSFANAAGADTATTWSEDNPDDTQPIYQNIDTAYDLFVSKGMPLILGEMGAINKDNLEARARYAEFYVRYAKSKGMPCFWWDNGGLEPSREMADGNWNSPFGLLNRETSEFVFLEIVEGLMRGTA
ncbi:MAG: glycoside hydrolase family 5 protein [Oscillospiraceae bacterium]|nr:glycoside hydrolase family 5 protein [Oscillospiraceae bacterium]